MLQTVGARASCEWLELRTIDELINRFSLGLIQRLNQIKGSGYWAGGNKGSHKTRKLGRKMGKKSGPTLRTAVSDYICLLMGEGVGQPMV